MKAPEMPGIEHCRVVVEEIDDLALQRPRVVLQDYRNLTLIGRQRADHLFLQERHTLAHCSQWCLQLVRDMAQHAHTIGFEVGKALTQPVEALAKTLQVIRPADFDRRLELPGAQAADRRLQRQNRPSQPPADDTALSSS